jgi:hypothetical protein
MASCAASGGCAESELPGHSIHNSWTASRGQEDASAALQLAKGGEGDRSQGCADPRGRTWTEG